ncbi:two component transcriptional regulator, LuxR family [Candidatus Koribacter versatilis Ellin345]|uniref:Two component transcriptional regulator, LuxR family n=1 Tax=Koribacter versatilis (strain Ellin345) TaxID=204669 RepID=Q1INV4_KORVE|nr:response regulator [Candidatus Koribacter versatilis]ABF41446.1 two component transcriptional regulator, LuxR family [Candidatus Koribacter versatilis Ellin345]
MSSAHAFNHQLGFPPVSHVTPIVFVVDADTSVRDSLDLLIRTQGWQAETFRSAREFLSRPRSHVASCLILNQSLPDTNGLDLQQRIARERPDMPVIFISGSQDIPTTVLAMKAGAVNFLIKPFRNDALLDAIREGLDRSRFALDRAGELRELRECYSSLTPRERQVMALVTHGLLNKQVGGELGITEITVKAHRGQVMQKMKANSLADLVRMSGKLGSMRQAIHLA